MVGYHDVLSRGSGSGEDDLYASCVLDLVGQCQLVLVDVCLGLEHDGVLGRTVLAQAASPPCLVAVDEATLLANRVDPDLLCR